MATCWLWSQKQETETLFLRYCTIHSYFLSSFTVKSPVTLLNILNIIKTRLVPIGYFGQANKHNTTSKLAPRNNFGSTRYFKSQVWLPYFLNILCVHFSHTEWNSNMATCSAGPSSKIPNKQEENCALWNRLMLLFVSILFKASSLTCYASMFPLIWSCSPFSASVSDEDRCVRVWGPLCLASWRVYNSVLRYLY